MSVNDYLLDLDIEVMCDELGITAEDIIYRFRDKVHAYNQRVDRADQWDYDEGLDEDLPETPGRKSLDELLDEMD